MRKSSYESYCFLFRERDKKKLSHGWLMGCERRTTTMMLMVTERVTVSMIVFVIEMTQSVMTVMIVMMTVSPLMTMTTKELVSDDRMMMLSLEVIQ